MSRVYDYEINVEIKGKHYQLLLTDNTTWAEFEIWEGKVGDIQTQLDLNTAEDLTDAAGIAMKNLVTIIGGEKAGDNG